MSTDDFIDRQMQQLLARNSARDLYVPDLEPGQQVGSSEYVVVRMLGRGTFGDVYEACNRRQDGPEWNVAIKLLRTRWIKAGEVKARFQREAGQIRSINHPHVVKVEYYGEHHGRPFFAMELLRGQDLKKRLQRGPRLPWSQIHALACQLLDGLHALHHEAGVIHRDIKPSNIFVCCDEPFSIKIIDLGLAMGAEAGAGDTGGTPGYRAPEQRGGKADHRSDLYSAAVVLYEVIRGCLPASGPDRPEPLHVVHDDVSEALGRVIECAMDPNPDKRFQTAQAFRDALQRVFHRGRVRARWRARAGRLVKARQIRSYLAVGASVLVVGLGVGLLISSDCRGVERSGMVCVPSGRFMMGTADVEPLVVACVDAIALDKRTSQDEQRCRERLEREQGRYDEHIITKPFLLDRYEVAQHDWVDWINREVSIRRDGVLIHDADSGRPMMVVLPEIHRWVDGRLDVDSKYAHRPATGVTWYGADAFCKAQDKRLPTEIEWEYAARGDDAWIFGAPSPIGCDEVVFGRSLDADFAIVCPGPPEPVDSKDAYGDDVGGALFHMRGNVSEWVVDRQQDSQGGILGVVKGGSFAMPAVFSRPAVRGLVSPSFGLSDLGFRCAADPAPSR